MHKDGEVGFLHGVAFHCEGGRGVEDYRCLRNSYDEQVDVGRMGRSVGLLAADGPSDGTGQVV